MPLAINPHFLVAVARASAPPSAYGRAVRRRGAGGPFRGSSTYSDSPAPRSGFAIASRAPQDTAAQPRLRFALGMGASPPVLRPACGVTAPARAALPSAAKPTLGALASQ